MLSARLSYSPSCSNPFNWGPIRQKRRGRFAGTFSTIVAESPSNSRSPESSGFSARRLQPETTASIRPQFVFPVRPFFHPLPCDESTPPLRILSLSNLRFSRRSALNARVLPIERKRERRYSSLLVRT